MPHIILEHSKNIPDKINYQNFFKEIIDVFIFLEIVKNPSGIKCRFIEAKEDFLWDKDRVFIHLTVSLLEGRDVEKLKALGEAINEEVSKKYFCKSREKYGDSCFSLEIREMNSKIYQK